jgi:2-oxo-4-hydroxy-4-carboxy-5-ureidoimidazoline decarboxylase
MFDIQTVNRMDRDTFMNTFGGVFEHSPWIAERAWSARPFNSPEALHAAMIEVVRAASPEEKLRLLNAHPELAGKEARERAMTQDSTVEQGSAGLDRMSADDFARFDRLNAAYREKFGFPFIIAVRGRTKPEIVAAFEQRLANEPSTELDAALKEIAAITRMRMEKLFWSFRSQDQGLSPGSFATVAQRT